jgi:2-polyprenyl-3-methyl-5-hydroxy-6-metoxy-1,4-benzoquinol methylase
MNSSHPLRLLHFVPEPCLKALLRSFENIDYLSVHLVPGQAMKKEDITNLSFGDKTFDVVMCLQVLEHIEDDRQAIREISGVLTIDGFAVLGVPVDYGREKTFEDSSIQSLEARTEAFCAV